MTGKKISYSIYLYVLVYIIFCVTISLIWQEQYQIAEFDTLLVKGMSMSLPES